MTWLRIDDGMVDHRKWAALEEDPRAWAECLAVWVALGSYCARVTSDGFVEDARVGRLTPLGAKARQRCDDLVRVGLMDREEGGYRFHDWLDYQPSAADVARDREAARVRQQRARDEARSRRESRDLSRRDDRCDSRRESQSTDAVSNGPPVPTRPDPSLPLLRSGADARAPAGARGLPPSASAAFDRRCEEVRRALSAAVTEVRKGPLPPALSLGTSHGREVSDIARWLATAEGVDLEAMARRWASSRQKGGAWVPLSWLAQDPTEWASEPPSASAVRLTPEQDQASIEDLMRAGGAM